ncbi:DNA polymerase delta catalytic subunit [Symbiodinium microadriaticum]|uniref:DNA-directed DNA polymerase n=1 Tax=Symbiodinium microadriaticum TaxID=2951 RepID=A0A1Q9DVK9_SYMMI|nr:DNA polymerase delta catalytic subunit [Symbiodinium microadriaticum]
MWDQEKAPALAVLDEDAYLSEEDLAVPSVESPCSQSSEVASLVMEPWVSPLWVVLGKEQRRAGAHERLKEVLVPAPELVTAALDEATQAQVEDESLLSTARSRLQDVKDRDIASDLLMTAVEALEEAKAKGVAEQELQHGEQVLAEELPRAQAVQQLQGALREAIALAKQARLPAEELLPFEEDCVCVALKQTPSRAAWILMTPHVILTLQALQLMPTTEEGRGLGLGTARVGRGTARGKRLLLGKVSETLSLGSTEQRKKSRQSDVDIGKRVVYGDTDSVMLTLGRTLPIDDVFALGKEAAQIVSDAFGAPVKMEFEKVYHPFLLMNKKRYAGLSFGSPEDAGKLDFKGIEVVRRDWCLLARKKYPPVFGKTELQRYLRTWLGKSVFHDTDQDADYLPEAKQETRADSAQEQEALHYPYCWRAVEYVRETVAALRAGRIDYRLLVLSKALVRAGAEEYAARQAHVELAERLRKADPAQAPKVGERVPYVFVAKGNGANACDRAEDPLKALEVEGQD